MCAGWRGEPRPTGLLRGLIGVISVRIDVRDTNKQGYKRRVLVR